MNYSRELASLSTRIRNVGIGNPMGTLSTQQATPTSLSQYISPIQFMRMASDIKDLGEGWDEAENAYFPFRTKFMRIFIDTIENPFVKSVIERKKELFFSNSSKYNFTSNIDECKLSRLF